MSTDRELAAADGDPLDLAIQRLVDDELTPSETASLLRRMEQEPDSWRRCTLSFVEDRVWSRSARAWRQECARADRLANVASFNRPVPRQTHVARAWHPTATLAASVLLAFVLGWTIHAIDDWSVEPPRHQPRTRPLVGRDSEPRAKLPQNVLTNAAARQAPAGSIVLMSGAEPDSESVELPLYAPSQDQMARLLSHPELISDELQQRLRDRGYLVNQQRRLTSISLEDGRQIVLPIDEVTIEHRARPIY